MQMSETWAAVGMQAGRDKSREDASFEVHLRSNGDDGKLQSSSRSWLHKSVEKGGEVRETKTASIRSCVSFCNTEYDLKGENTDVEGEFASQDRKLEVRRHWKSSGRVVERGYSLS